MASAMTILRFVPHYKVKEESPEHAIFHCCPQFERKRMEIQEHLPIRLPTDNVVDEIIKSQEVLRNVYTVETAIQNALVVLEAGRKRRFAIICYNQPPDIILCGCPGGEIETAFSEWKSHTTRQDTAIYLVSLKLLWQPLYMFWSSIIVNI